MSKKILLLTILVCFIFSSVMGPDMARAQALNLPVPGALIAPAPAFMPVMMKGVRVHEDNALLFDFMMDAGNSGFRSGGIEFRAESEKLIKYFLASLAIRDENMWVNLSPFEKDRVIADDLGRTLLGRDMLAQDYVLKRLTASFIYPEKELGREFWKKVYARAQEEFGTTDIPVDTFNKVWIMGDKAKVLERNNVGYVVGMHLKVMLESDYVAMSQQKDIAESPAPSGDVSMSQQKRPGTDMAKDILREIIIPALEEQVNAGAHFAPLRQIFSAMILSSWYKKALKESLLNQVYSYKGKTAGIESDDPVVREKIYDEYLKVYQKGVFNFVKEESDAVAGDTIVRKYFSGGVVPGRKIMDPEVAHEPVPGDDMLAIGDMAEVTVRIDPLETSGNGEGDLPFPDLRASLEERKSVAEVGYVGTNGRIRTVLSDKDYAWWIVFMAETVAKYYEARGRVVDLQKVRFLALAKAWGGPERLTAQGVVLLDDRARDLKVLADPARSSDTMISDEARMVLLAGYWANIIKRFFMAMGNGRITFVDRGLLKKKIRPGALTRDVFSRDCRYPPEFDRVGLSPGIIYLLAKAGQNIGNVDWDHGLFDLVVDDVVAEFLGMNLDMEAVLRQAGRISDMMDRLSLTEAGYPQSYMDGSVMFGKGWKSVDPAQGGLDLNMHKTWMDIVRQGKGIEMAVDAAMINRFRDEDLSGVVAVILKITPLEGPLSLLGLAG